MGGRLFFSIRKVSLIWFVVVRFCSMLILLFVLRVGLVYMVVNLLGVSVSVWLVVLVK